MIGAYRERLDGLLGLDDPVTLLEGSTPLIPAPRLAEWACPGAELFLKFEGLNPTGSFKDRGMTTAITHARAEGARTVICASTGNTAASAAAYAVRGGLSCAVLVPAGKVAIGKLAGALAYGAKVIEIEGSFDDALRLVREVAERTPIALVNSVNPARMQGQKTASFEILEDLGRAPDLHALPVGNAGNITAYWMGYQESGVSPRMLGVQASGAAPLVIGHPVEKPETIATAIRIGNPARGDQALAAARDSGGAIVAVSDEQILEAYQKAAQLEGVFCEPSSAAGLAGLRSEVLKGAIEPEGLVIVTTLTGHGLKDPDAVNAPSPTRISNDFNELLKAIQ